MQKLVFDVMNDVKQRILVIEDEEAIQESILDVLSINEFEVTCASDGRTGLQLAKAFHPDLILCDINMPELDGYSVLSELRKDAELELIPFVFLTALADMQNLRHGMQLGADDYLTKPIQISDLLEAIATRLNRQARVSDHYTNALKKDTAPIPTDNLKPRQRATDNLTPRQREILQLIAKGKTTKEIADKLFISIKTVETHRGQIMERLNIHELASLVRYAIRIGLVDLNSD